MVNATRNLGFRAEVSLTGYRWLTVEELGADGPIENQRMMPFEGPFLIEARDPGTEAERVLRRPGDNPSLFREFAELEPNDLDAIAGFATENGPLGIVEQSRSLVDWSRRPERHELGDWVTGLRHQDRAAGGEPGLHLVRMHKYASTLEDLRDWARAIVELKAAVQVHDLVRTRNTAGLRKIFRWCDSADINTEEAGAVSWHIDTRSDRGSITPNSRATVGAVSWHIDTRSDQPANDFSNNRFYQAVGLEERFWELCSPHAPIEKIALSYLAYEVTANLREKVGPALSLGEDGKLHEYLQPESLFALLWAQLYVAIGSDRGHKKCPGCGKWFEIGGAEGATVRRMYCSDKCRVRLCQARRDRAGELAVEGLAPDAILERMKAEGHETDLKTVKGWAKDAIKRRGQQS